MSALRITGLAAGPVASPDADVAAAAVFDGLDIDAAATHCSVVSSDGSYRASIPLDELRRGGVFLVVPAEEGGPVRLRVMDGSTLCWNVKDVGELKFTEGAEPDSIPADPTH